jgi:CRISPR-associated protein Csx17
LLRLADVEAVQITGSGIMAGPIPRLRPAWVNAADDNSPELRLALALALQASEFSQDGRPQRDAGVRRHWLSLDGTRFATTGGVGQQRLAPQVDRVMQGRRGIDDAIALVDRRIIEASQSGVRCLPLKGARKAFARPSDLAKVLAGEVDLDRTLALARSLMAIDRSQWARQPAPPAAPSGREMPDDGWMAIRLALSSRPLSAENSVGADPAIFRRLESGDVAGAVKLALRRLRAAGIHAAISVAHASPDGARQWAAALAFPIAPKTADAFAQRLAPNSSEETAA